jgi:hypothetical protein
LYEEIKKNGTPFPVIGSQDVPSGKKGAKSFLAFKTHPDFLDYINRKPEKDRNQYEIIDHDQNSFMHLDVDSKDTKEPEVLWRTLVKDLEAFLAEIRLDGSNILTLSASDSTKTSFHLIIRGDWVTSNCTVRSRLHSLFVSWLKANDPTFPTEVIDPKVYSSWQNFRTIYSTKLGTKRPLTPYKATVELDPLHYFVTYIDDPLKYKVINLDDLPRGFPAKAKTALFAVGADCMEELDCDSELELDDLPLVNVPKNGNSSMQASRPKEPSPQHNQIH